MPLFFAQGARSLIELAGLKGGERVLDVACETGIVARTTAERLGNHGTVIGLDLNEGIIEVAHTTSSNLHPLIEWRKGDVKEIPFHDLSFDVIFLSARPPIFSQYVGCATRDTSCAQGNRPLNHSKCLLSSILDKLGRL